MAKRLGDILMERGWLDKIQLAKALVEQKKTKMHLGSFLLQRGLVTRDQLAEAFSEQFEVPFFAIDMGKLHHQLVRLVPESFARRRNVSPVGLEGTTLRLGMVWPGDMEAISEVELLTGYQVEAGICLVDELDRLLDEAFDDRIEARQTAIDIRFAEMAEGNDKEEEIELEAEEAEAPVVRLVRSILMGAVRATASDIHLEPHVPQMRVRYRVDGQLQQIMTIPDDSEEAVIGRIKVMADMDTAEKRRPQDGTLTIEEGESRASFRVSCIPCVRGEKVVLRVLDETSKTFSFDALGMPRPQIKKIKQLLTRPHGMMVMTGPTGSGKTTTMYSMLCSIDSAQRNVSTIEDPVEFRLPGINQVQANNEFGMGFANGLKYLMRQDPDVILVGEIRDHETATTAVQAALTGHLLISTLHTNDAIGTIARLNDLGLDNFKIAGSLLAAIAQRLLRRLCTNCKKECKPNKSMLEGLFEGREVPSTIKLDGPFYSGRGCDHCGGTGYSGRIPIYEILAVSPALEKGIEQGLPATKLREIAAEEGMTELAIGGIQYAQKGLTTVEDVYYKLSG